MKKAILLSLCSVLSCFGEGFLPIGIDTSGLATTADLATKLSTNDLVNTLSGDEADKAVTPQAVNAGLSTIQVPSGRQILVTATTNATSNGTALLAAYATAEGMTPAVSNEVTIVLPPETYDIGTNTLNMTSEYINIVGQIPVTVCDEGVVILDGVKGQGAVLTGEVPKTLIKSSGTAIDSTIGNGLVAFVKIEGDVYTAGDKAQVWQDVWFAGNVDKESSSSNMFIRVNATLGICGDPDHNYGGQNLFYGTVQNSTVSGSGCLGGSAGTMSGTVQNSTVSGDYCLGGGYGAMSGTVQNSTVSGDYCLGGDSGTISGRIFRTDVSGPNQMSNASYTTNAIVSFSTGIDPAITNSVAKVFNSADSSYNLIPNQ